MLLLNVNNSTADGTWRNGVPRRLRALVHHAYGEFGVAFCPNAHLPLNNITLLPIYMHVAETYTKAIFSFWVNVNRLQKPHLAPKTRRVLQFHRSSPNGVYCICAQVECRRTTHTHSHITHILCRHISTSRVACCAIISLAISATSYMSMRVSCV